MKAAPKVRILAGRFKGRVLEAPAGARPTSGRAREALFSILHDSIQGAAVLDLYAGSGAVGLEAVSRGAARAVLAEREAAALRKNVEKLDPEGAFTRVLSGDADRALAVLSGAGESFDLVFADPPYGEPLPHGLLAAAASLLSPGGLCVLQRDGPSETPPEPAGVALVERRRYGRNVFFFYARAGSSLDLCAPEDL
jgi:16S rRNA (guanine(966)-N(2))-methyltransferase RsmD